MSLPISAQRCDRFRRTWLRGCPRFPLQTRPLIVTHGRPSPSGFARVCCAKMRTRFFSRASVCRLAALWWTLLQQPGAQHAKQWAWSLERSRLMNLPSALGRDGVNVYSACQECPRRHFYVVHARWDTSSMFWNPAFASFEVYLNPAVRPRWQPTREAMLPYTAGVDCAASTTPETATAPSHTRTFRRSAHHKRRRGNTAIFVGRKVYDAL
jgi:hypothetical protein